MKYSMVKQFSNNALDNVFNFFFKIVDFGKECIEFFWSFFEIWYAFFMIFYNVFMYMYYLLLFVLDKIPAFNAIFFFWRRSSSGRSMAPKIEISKVPTPVSSMYIPVTKTVSKAADSVSKAAGSAASSVASTASSVASTASSTMDSLRQVPLNTGGKQSRLKVIGEFFADFFSAAIKIITAPFSGIVNFFEKNMRPVKEDDAGKAPRKKSLIDEYMKEYEKKRK
ncbi:MAG: hypothetical protein GY754_41280 [bacterium]|nr:hypothetical protein [bacterium]